MKGSRTWLVWAALAICAATILAAMTWQTRNAIASERDRIAAEGRADQQEKMRLALWRMDSLGAPLAAGEIDGGPEGLVKSRVEWRENGQLVLPSGAPAPVELQRAITDEKSPFEKVYRTIDQGADRWRAVPVIELEKADHESPTGEKKQQFANKKELEQRNRTVDSFSDKAVAKDSSRMPAPAAEAMAPAADAMTPAEDRATPTVSNRTLLRPIWIGENLFLLTTSQMPQRTISGAWIDLTVLQDHLLKEIRDLLPAAKLLPAKTPSDDGLVLASFPLRLDPGPLTVIYRSQISAATTYSIVFGWTAAIIAILAASLLIFGVMRLSERRASFVSAVTHELRTPLTTFRLYSDMLQGDVVKPEKRGDYLRVLSREADRLAHLVENVLAFSRIERGSARTAIATKGVSELLEPMRERFETRLASAGMSLVMVFENPDESLRVDATAIEHILFNLVDNAAKYAASATPPVLRISTKKRAGFLEIHVSDHGPGIAETERKRIFRAFHKSARDAAESQPGVGLGLALSRRLARELGGDLTCAKSGGTGGAKFTLSIPL